MLNQNKIRIMTRLSIYEQGKGKEDLKINQYYKFDYLRLQIIKSLVCCTLGSVLLIILVALYKAEYLILNATKLEFATIGKYVLLIFIMVSIFYLIITTTGAVIRYNKAKKSLKKYNVLLRKLRKSYAANNVAKR